MNNTNHNVNVDENHQMYASHSIKTLTLSYENSVISDVFTNLFCNNSYLQADFGQQNSIFT